MNKLQLLFKNMTISKRIGSIFFSLNIILLIVVILFLRITFGDTLLKKYEEKMQYESVLVHDKIDVFSDNINACINNVILEINDFFIYDYKDKKLPSDDDIELTRKVLNYVRYNLILFNEPEEISIIFENDLVLNKDRYEKDSREIINNVYNEICELDISTTGVWLNSLSIKKLEREDSIYFVKKLINMNDNSQIGVVIIYVSVEKIENLYKNKMSTKDESSYLFLNDGFYIDNKGDILNDTNEPIHKILQDCNKDSGVTKIENKDYIYMCKPVNNDLWTLATFVNKDEIMKETNATTVWIIFFSSIIIIIYFITIIIMYRRITKPIFSFVKNINKLNNNIFGHLPEIGSIFELNYISKKFNSILSKNKDLFFKFHETEKQKEYLELALMQSQIKPHFLYNTLDTIYCLIDLEDTEKAKDVVLLLSDYYRYILNQGVEWVSMEKEIALASKYLEIQKIRYRHLLEFEINLSQDIMQMQIPKLTLQPLIENAIYHGIKPKDSGGKIKIVGEIKKEHIVISVIDDGVGMDADKFNSVISLEKIADKNNFGLKNVLDRLKLFYGKQTRMELESGDDKETIISIYIFLGTVGEEDV